MSSQVQGATFRETYDRLAQAQKGVARSAPAYSRYVNRRLGRVFAAWAYGRGLTPNQVTGISALFTFTGIGVLAATTPRWWAGLVVSLCLVIGYAFDSADGQVARLSGTGSSAGEWLDHMVDATKVAVLPLALAVSFYRAEAMPTVWLLVPLLNAVVSSVLFFGMILTEQMRKAHGVRSTAPTGGSGLDLRALLMTPTDYGVLCLVFLLLGAVTVFAAVYSVIVALTAAFLVAAARKWFREIAALGQVG
ncbi:CDP-alcohol phosphatidyltransferase-like enzyme [Flavimobilis soli]|uniref:CDP-alcohol phosphatidyltransferase-like enzyme n=1 Tax=Flavimobilis soli TaxID=442709 RepID=A0A2A9EGY6_9MICO|nr:CDP-alcohol phosphatidyltransferase family protein [Flavimobilis soli]PFG37502.1 CDP-alcohol phosphatidyltransferase-like enzyme [Flavimobilis soli]